ncbi:acid protease [Mycena metata]|uniref:Acid protease n=1 Tax=Mycena metata TaxID=1033252 RepID=A0AAD7N6G6_9AGAR|nr:acid protease [Mycena metata]
MLFSLALALAAATAALATAPHSDAKFALTSIPSTPDARRTVVATSRASSGNNVKLFDYFNGTDLQWYGQLSLGTPLQNFTVVFDTGSVSLEVPGVACGAACANQRQFDPSKSSTFQDEDYNTTVTFGTGIGVDPVVGNNWEMDLAFVADVLVVGDINVPLGGFFLITNQTSTFLPDPFDGIMGLSPDMGDFFADAGLPAIFGMWFTPKSGKAEGAGELTLGGVDTTKFKEPLLYSPIVNDAWQPTSQGIFVNDKTTSTLNKTFPITFDSGTSNILFVEETALAIYNLISPDIVANPDEPGTFGIACDRIPTLPAVISIQFAGIPGQGSFNLTIPSSELSSGPFTNKPELCQTLINVSEGFNLIGLSLLKHYYTAWDINGTRMGFSPNGF